MDALRGLITPPETEDRGNKKAIILIGLCLFVVLLGLLLLQVKGKKRERRTKDVQDRPVAARELEKKQEMPRQNLRYKSTYSGLALEGPPTEPSLPLLERPAPPPGALDPDPVAPVSLPTAHGPPPAPPPPAGLPPPPAGAPPPPAPRARDTGARRPPGPLRRVATEPRTPDKKRTHWLEEDTKAAVEQPPFPLKEGTEQEQAGSRIFPKAVWARPKEPGLVLYQDQLVQGILMGDFDSDAPGPIRILVTQQVESRGGEGFVLIPQYTVLIGQPDGAVRYGQVKVPGTVKSGIFPDGTGIEFEGKLGDSTGSMGMSGKVNNHYGKLALGVGATALLNIGARVPFGSPGQGQYQQNLPQEFSQDVAQGVNQAGQAVIQRELAVNPTITQTHGYAVSVAFTKNISFQTERVIVSK